MPVDQALPDEAPFGVALWDDYADNWRQKDAEWLQSRGILRFATAAARDAAIGTPQEGQLVYNATGSVLQLRKPTGWTDFKPLPANLTTTQDDATAVLIGHSLSSGKGISFGGVTPFEVHVNTDFKVQNGVLLVQTSGVSIKTGARTAKLTTDALNLVSDSPVSAPSIILTGTGTVLSAPGKTVAVGTLTADSAAVTSGTIGGVALGTSGIGGSNLANASGGFQSQQGMFYGDGTSALIRQRAANGGALGTAQIQVTATDISLSGTLTSAGTTNLNGVTNFVGQARVRNGNSIEWYNAASTLLGRSGPVIYSASDPGAANYPEGTIWFS